MGILYPGKLPKHRQFRFEPRFYNPDEDRTERTLLRRRGQKRAASTQRRLIYFAALLSIAVYLYLALS